MLANPLSFNRPGSLMGVDPNTVKASTTTNFVVSLIESAYSTLHEYSNSSNNQGIANTFLLSSFPNSLQSNDFQSTELVNTDDYNSSGANSTLKKTEIPNGHLFPACSTIAESSHVPFYRNSSTKNDIGDSALLPLSIKNLDNVLDVKTYPFVVRSIGDVVILSPQEIDVSQVSPKTSTKSALKISDSQNPILSKSKGENKFPLTANPSTISDTLNHVSNFAKLKSALQIVRAQIGLESAISLEVNTQFRTSPSEYKETSSGKNIGNQNGGNTAQSTMDDTRSVRSVPQEKRKDFETRRKEQALIETIKKLRHSEDPTSPIILL